MYNNLIIKKAYKYIKYLVADNANSSESRWGASLCQGLILLGCLWLTWQNVEVRWSEADLTLTQMIPIVGIIGAILLIMNRRQWHWTWSDILALAWGTWWGLRLWTGGEYPCGTVAMKVMTMALLYVVLRLAFCGCDRKMLTLWAGFLLIGGTVEALWGICQMWEGASRHSSYLLTGNFLNPGPYSAYLMIGTVAGIDPPLTPPRGRMKPILSKITMIMTIICLAVLPATWSRAAWVGTGVLALWIFRHHYWKWRWWLWGALLLGGILLFCLKQGSAEGRLVIWASALSSWWKHPVLGVGIGGFKQACAEGIAELYSQHPTDLALFRSAGVTEYSFNALIEILVEQGCIGALLCLAWVGSILWRLQKVCKPLAYSMIALLIFACFSYPFATLPYCLIWMVTAALGASVTLPQEEGKRDKSHSWGLPLLMGLVTIGLCYPLRQETQRRLEASNDATLLLGMHDSFFLKDFWELLPEERDNPRFLFEMGKMLNDKGRWRDSNALLQMGTLVSGDPMFYVLMGNNYRKMEMNDLAEESYKKAFAILPNRHYPLYQLMLLYEESNRHTEAIQMARQIIEMPPKVKSPATDEMQKRAQEIIKKKV